MSTAPYFRPIFINFASRSMKFLRVMYTLSEILIIPWLNKLAAGRINSLIASPSPISWPTHSFSKWFVSWFSSNSVLNYNILPQSVQKCQFNMNSFHFKRRMVLYRSKLTEPSSGTSRAWMSAFAKWRQTSANDKLFTSEIFGTPPIFNFFTISCALLIVTGFHFFYHWVGFVRFTLFWLFVIFIWNGLVSFANWLKI